MTDPSPPLLHRRRSLDDTIEHFIGDFSLAQLFQTLILSLAWFFDAQQTFITVFTDATNTNHSNNCTITATCSTSIVSEWSLTSPVMRGLPASAFFSGCLVGGFVLGSLADSYTGRKNMLVLSSSLMSVAGFLTAFATNVWVYAGLRFVSGFGRSAIGTCALVLASELVGKKWRGNVGIIGFLLFGLGFLSLPGVAYLLEGSSWRLMYLGTSIPSIVYSILVYFVVCESPRWLFIKGRRRESIEALKRLASPEKLDVGDYNPKIESLLLNCANWEENPEELDMYSALKILLNKSWALWRLVAVMVVAFGLGMIYYGMPLSLGNLPFNQYISVTLNALSELPASLITFFLIGKLNRRGSVLGLGLLSGICSVTCALVTNKTAKVSMELVSFFCACTAVDVLLIYALELFPTCVRNSAVSMVRQAVVVSGVVSPMLVAAGRRNAWLSYGVFGATVMVCGLFVVYLPETRGRTPCDTMEEEEGKYYEERPVTHPSPPPPMAEQAVPPPASAVQQENRSLDDTIEHFIGDFGWKQFIQSTIISITWFFDAQQSFISVFTDTEPKWSCNSTSHNNLFSCDNNDINICQLPRDSWSWDLPARTSIVSEWSLECVSSIIRGLPASSFFVGSVAGTFMLATLADSHLGRKKMLVLSCLIMSLAGVLNAVVSTNVWMYSAMRFISGLGRSTATTCALVLSSELVGKKWRGSVGVLGFVLFTLGFLSLPAIAYLLRGSSWRLIYLCTCVPAILYSMVVYFFVHESPRWLFVKGRKREFMKTLESFASPARRINMTESFVINGVERAEKTEENDTYSALKILLKRGWAFRRLLATMVLGFGVSLIYFGMPLSLGNLEFNLYLSVTLNAISELPASLIAFFLITKLNRKVSLLGLTYLSGICSVACVLVRRRGMRIALELLSFLSACAAFDVILIYALELFPTCVRNSAMSMVRQASSFAGALSPLLVAAGRKNRWVSYGVFGVAILISGSFVACLPETRQRMLSDTMEEEEQKGREVNNNV